MHKALLVGMSLAATACSCGGGETTGQVAKFSSTLQADPLGEADYLVDFGEVVLGDQALERVEVRNSGNRELVVVAGDLAAPFSGGVSTAGLKLGVGEAREIVFGFEPEEESEEPIQTILSLQTNEGDAKTYTVRLVGQGKRASLDCEPAELDFGPVLKGGAKTLTTVCNNSLSIPIAIEGQRIRGVDASFFQAALTDAVEGGLVVPAGGAVTFEVSFSAHSAGRNEAALGLSGSFNQPLASIPLRAETVESSLGIEPSSCLDFSYVHLGDSSVAEFEVRAVGGRPLQITSITLPQESQAAFSLLAQGPISLEPDGAAQRIEVEFHPVTGGPHQTLIEIQTEELLAGPQTINACAKGFGGGPAISCTPTAIDFGRLGIGMSGRRTFDCINSGVSAPGAVIDPLLVTGIRSTAPQFAVTLLNLDGSEGAKREGYELGETFEVEVLYTPTSERFDAAAIQIDTLSAPGGMYEVAVSGQGRDLPSCEFALVPPQLGFGIVDRGEERSLKFGVTNLLDTPCLIHDLGLSTDSEDAFSVAPIESVEVGGFETFEVEVVFAPKSYKALFTGAVEFQISSGEEVEQRVPLQGAAANPCLLIEPAALDFGMVGPGCSSTDIWVSVTNVCPPPIDVIGTEINDGVGSDAFLIQRRPVLPRRLLTNERIELQLAFQPERLGEYSGSLRIDLQDSLPYVSKLSGSSVVNPLQTDIFNQTASPKVDILWVMDNSTSMRHYQRQVSENLSSFLSSAIEQKVDFHLAVTSNGLRKASNLCYGGADGGEDGRLFPIDGSHPRVLTPRTPFLETHWEFNARVGLCHADEFHIEAAFRALSEPLISESKSSKYFDETPYNDGNAGFLRREASLSIIFVSDEPDKSDWMPLSDYLAFFRGLKGKNMFRAHAITGRKASSAPDPACALRNGDRLIYLAEETGGTWMDICTPTSDSAAWEAGLKDMSLAAFGFRARFILRGEPSDVDGDGEVTEEDIVLEVNGVPTPAVAPGQVRQWSLDKAERAILFTPLFIPKTGSQITATYSVACMAP